LIKEAKLDWLEGFFSTGLSPHITPKEMLAFKKNRIRTAILLHEADGFCYYSRNRYF